MTRTLGVVARSRRRRLAMRVPVLLVVAATVVTSVAVPACRAQRAEVPLTRLRIGVGIPPSFSLIPDVSAAAEVRVRFAPLATYLESAVGVPVDISGSRNANGVLAEFEAGRYDLVFFGAAHFTHAREKIGAIPLVMREEDRRTTSMFVTSAADPRMKLDDFRGARFGFGPVLSSSHLNARNFLERHGITPEKFFGSVSHSAGPEETVQLVADGKIDLGVGTTITIARLVRPGGPFAGKVRVVIETPPYVNLLWAAAPTLPITTRTKLRDAFLALTLDKPEHRPTLESLNATAFLPAFVEDYAALAELMRREHLMDMPLETQ
jgi:phosphonate transport system substrate-binding protein